MPYYGISNNTLYIAGTSTSEATTSFSYPTTDSETYPWITNERGSITTVIVQNKITPTLLNSCFDDFESLTSIQGIENIDTSNVTSLTSMFTNCSSLTSINLNSWDVSKVTNFSRLFYGCTGLKTINVNGWDTKSATVLSNAFYKCQSLETLNLSNWKVDNVTSLGGVFVYCSVLKSINLGNWNPVSATVFTNMFNNCPLLERIYCNKTWTGASGATGTSVFKECPLLKGAISFDSSKVSIDYANPTTGYFTATSKGGYIGISINEIPKSTDTSGNIYNGKGYKENTYINTTAENAETGMCCTGFIPFTLGDTIYFKNMEFGKSNQHRIHFWDTNKSYLGFTQTSSTYYMNQYSPVTDSNGYYTQITPIATTANGTASGAAYIRISAAGIDSDSIITVNKEPPATVAECEVAFAIKQPYIGIDNVARKIVRAYIGDENGIARLFWGSGFPDQPTSESDYTLYATYTSSTTFTAPSDGWYKIEAHGASGNGGNAVVKDFYYDDDNTTYHVCLTGGSGAGSGYACSIVKLAVGDTINLTVGAVGSDTTAVINSSKDSYDTIIVQSGGNGGNSSASVKDNHGCTSYTRGAAGVAGSVSGGNVYNYQGSNGVRGDGSTHVVSEKNYSCPAGGSPAHGDGNAGGRGMGIYRSTAVTDSWTGSEWLPYRKGYGVAGYFKISIGNTN